MNVIIGFKILIPFTVFDYLPDSVITEQFEYDDEILYESKMIEADIPYTSLSEIDI